MNEGAYAVVFVGLMLELLGATSFYYLEPDENLLLDFVVGVVGLLGGMLIQLSVIGLF